jgi:cysteine synthase A
MLPDTGERYLSTPLFDGIMDDMTEEEMQISQSTPNYHFASAPPPAPADDDAAEDTATAPKEIVEFFDEVTGDSESPVVLFALEWCEFCWSVRKMFAEYEVPYRAIDLDSVAYQDGNRGSNIRKVIEQRTGLKTIPQIYVGGKHLGGASETFDAVKDGSFQKLLEENNVVWNKEVNTEPYSFLPGWLHKR